jgi:hypothetical protein
MRMAFPAPAPKIAIDTVLKYKQLESLVIRLPDTYSHTVIIPVDSSHLKPVNRARAVPGRVKRRI